MCRRASTRSPPRVLGGPPDVVHLWMCVGSAGCAQRAECCAPLSPRVQCELAVVLEPGGGSARRGQCQVGSPVRRVCGGVCGRPVDRGQRRRHCPRPARSAAPLVFLSAKVARPGDALNGLLSELQMITDVCLQQLKEEGPGEGGGEPESDAPPPPPVPPVPPPRPDGPPTTPPLLPSQAAAHRRPARSVSADSAPAPLRAHSTAAAQLRAEVSVLAPTVADVTSLLQLVRAVVALLTLRGVWMNCVHGLWAKSSSVPYRMVCTRFRDLSLCVRACDCVRMFDHALLVCDCVCVCLCVVVCLCLPACLPVCVYVCGCVYVPISE